MNSQNCQKNETTKNTQDTKNLSELSALSGLPSGWKWVKLGDVIDKISTTGIKLKQKEYLLEGKFPVVDQGRELIGGFSNDENLLIDCELPVIVFGDHTKVKKYIDFKFIVGADGVKVIKPKEIFNTKLFYYFLHCIKFPDKGYARHFQFVEKAYIPLPPLSEQKKIVEKIEELFSQLDSGVAALKKAKEQIRLYRQSMLAAAFSGKLTTKSTKDTENLSELSALSGLPSGWKWVKVSEVGEIITGTTPSKKVSAYYGNDFPLYKPTDLNQGINTRNASDNISKLGASKSRLLPEKSIMVTCIGATIGKTGMNRRVGATNQQINSIIVNEMYVPEFVYYFCISQFFQKQIKENASSTTLPILNKSKFESLPFIEVPKKEQLQIVSEIEKRFSEADNLEKAIDESLAKAVTLRQSILKQAFEGKLV